MTRSVRSAALLLGLLVALLLGGAGTASAHAALLSTDPAQNTVLANTPAAVTLRFSESVTLEPDAVRVFDPSGKRVDTGAAAHAGGDSDTASVRVDPNAAAAQGTYTVAWRVVSADGHPVAGAYTYSVGRTSAPATLTGVAGTGTGTTPTGFLYGLSRAIQYGAFALLAGAVGAVLLCWPGGVRQRSVQRLMLVGWAALLLSTLAELALRGTYEAGTGLGRVLDLSLLRQVLGERLGVLLAARVLLLSAAGVLLALLGAAKRRLWLGLGAAVLGVALALTWPLGDHASVGIQAPLAVVLDTIHVLAMALWLGGLTTVLLGLRRPTADGGIDAASVRRYSSLALCCVTALVATGVYQSWRGLGSWSALTTTAYGRLLLLKLGAVAVILAAAWISRRWVALLPADAAEAEAETSVAVEEPEPLAAAKPAAVGAGEAAERAADAADPLRAAQLARQERARAQADARRRREVEPARGMLLRSVGLEAAFAVVVLALTTALTNAAPGRAVAEQQAATAAASRGPVDVTLPYDTGGSTPSAKGKITLELDPARTGRNSLHAYLYDSTGKPVDVPELDVALTLKSKGLGPLTVKVDHLDIGHYGSADVQLPMPGAWTLAVTVRSDDIDETTVTAPVAVG